MTLVDTATLAVYLETTPREIRRMVANGTLTPVGQRGRGGRGRPGWFFDLDAVRASLDDRPSTADIGT